MSASAPLPVGDVDESAPSVTFAVTSRPGRDWDSVLATVEYALQPIVNGHTGYVFGCEALLKNVAAAGFGGVGALFDAAVADGVLTFVDRALRAKAVSTFRRMPSAQRLKLFFNLDNRCVAMDDYEPGHMAELLSAAGLSRDSVYMEVSERDDLGSAGNLQKVLQAYRDQGFRIALDDFGTGYAQLMLLQEFDPEIIKIDRVFIEAIETDRRKELFVAQMANLAHMLGAQVVAEGVESEEAYWACKRAGCDLMQGSFVSPPAFDVEFIPDHAPQVAELARKSRRREDSDRHLIRETMQIVEPIVSDQPPLAVIEFFQRHPDLSVAPVVDPTRQPLGFVRDADVKEFSYTPFGRELLQNPGWRTRLLEFVHRSPVSDMSTKLDRLLETFTSAHNVDGVILTENSRYVGFLDDRALLAAVNERNTLNARDQNPLTRLPGNSGIYRHMSRVLVTARRRRYLVYFDFDNFKPFNDVYGFRQGDRAILLFADLMNRHLSRRDWFVGHVGGDDFFGYAQSVDYEDVEKDVRDIQDRFAREVSTFYDVEARRQGYILGEDRDGQCRHMPLMTVSAVILQIPPERTDLTIDDLSPFAAVLKKEAKVQGLCSAGYRAETVTQPSRR